MPKFESHEFVVTDVEIQETGSVEVFEATSISQAVDLVVASKSLDGYTVKIGPTGRTVKAGNYQYAIVPSKR